MAKEKSVDLQNIIDEGLEKPTKRTIGEIVDDVLETQEPKSSTEPLSEEKAVTEPIIKEELKVVKQTQLVPEVLDEILVKVIEKAKTEEELEQLEEQTSNISGAPVELTDSPEFEIPDEYDKLDPGIIEYAKDDFLKNKTVDGNVYETGWAEIEDFNNAILGEKVGETITHGLDVERDKLETKVHLRIIDKQSTSILEEVQLEINNIKDERGVAVKHTSDDNTVVATAEKGIYWVSALENKVITRTSENFDSDKHRAFYKVTISKPIDIQKLVKEVLTQGPRGIPLYPTLGPINTSGLFNLAKNEIVTGRPAFNGGTSGVNSPFTVDSNFLVSLLNADLLDGYEAAAFAVVSHTHDDIYYTETELDAGQLDNRYYTETEHLDVSAGVGDAGKPIKLDAAGHVDISMINDSDISHANLTGTHNLTTDINHDTINGFAEEEHRVINDAGTLTIELFSASKIINDLSTKSDTTHDHNTIYLGITAKATDSELLDNHDSSYFSIDGHDHNDVYYTETEIGTILGGYFKLNESETITGRPAFNGGITGTSSPFTVDSTYKVTNLNADLLEGQHASMSAGNSTIVQRNASGYVYANYFNTTPDTVTSGVTQVCVETGDDGFIRHGTQAAIRIFIGAGSGNGLDADKVDGYHASSFLTPTPPIGFIYVQFNGKSTPGSLWGGSWTDQSATWAGRFFRATGGSAAAFGTPQDDAFQGHRHNVRKTSDGSDITGYASVITNAAAGASYGIVNSSTQGTMVRIGDAQANATHGSPRTASETRPTNYAVKIWERTS